ncbi:MAG: phage holin family protein [Alteraurantiacibacter sp.]
MALQEDDALVRSPYDGEARFADPQIEDTIAAPQDHLQGGERRSLSDDLGALFSDTKTYLDAELSYQKSRAGFVANRAKMGIAFGIVAAFFGILAAVGLTVGLIIALTPLITAWGATAVVVLAMLLVAYLLVRRAQEAFREMSAAMSPEEKEMSHD